MPGPRIFTSQLLRQHTSLQLEESPARHVAGALRLKPGAVITLFNGSGGEFSATVSTVDRKRVEVELGEQLLIERESSLPIHLGIAISRGERMDWIVQKSTELGVAEISPLNSERCEVKLKGERQSKKMAHWEKVAISACEQCGRNTLPRINDIQAVPDWMNSVAAGLKLVLHHRSNSGLSALDVPASLALLVGPEGGLSAAEITMAEASGFQPLTLGPRVLRTETAPLAALAILQSHWGDMH